jgi:hypothetical protein
MIACSALTWAETGVTYVRQYDDPEKVQLQCPAGGPYP